MCIITLNFFPEDIPLNHFEAIFSRQLDIRSLKCFKQELEARQKCATISKSTSKKEDQGKRPENSKFGGTSKSLTISSGKENDSVGLSVHTVVENILLLVAILSLI